MLGIELDSYLGIGDAIQFTHIPENIYHNTGQKVYDVSNSWVFDHNPYVIRGSIPSNINTLNMWNLSHHFPVEGFKSHADRFFIFFNNIFKTSYSPCLRHPRLYYNEEGRIKTDRILVHTTGKSETEPMHDDVISHISETYKDFEILQIGGPKDKPTPFKKMLGLGLWETAKLISESIMFIGINSGMMHMANCYTRVQKKILLPRDVEDFLPMSHHSVWFDHGNMYYNNTKIDTGATYSYTKI